jgi:hypothetical protein
VRHVRMLGLCLVAALALGAYAVSSASALEWGKCENVGAGGNYTGPNCTKAEKAKPKGTGEYEWRKASEVAEKRVEEGKSANVPFSGESVGGGGVLTISFRECAIEPELGGPQVYFRVTREVCSEIPEHREQSNNSIIKVECETETNTGEAQAKNKVANVKVVFTGCALFGVVPCETEGRPEGEIETNTLKGKLGWIKKSTKEVGVVLEPLSKKELFAAFVCGGGGAYTFVGHGNKKEGAENVIGENYPEGCYGGYEPIEHPGEGCPLATPSEERHGGYNQIISPITPVNTMTTEFEQVYTEEPEYPYQNIPNRFEKKHLSVLEAYLIGEELQTVTMWSSAGEIITNVNTAEEEGEIKA